MLRKYLVSEFPSCYIPPLCDENLDVNNFDYIKILINLNSY